MLLNSTYLVKYNEIIDVRRTTTIGNAMHDRSNIIWYLIGTASIHEE